MKTPQEFTALATSLNLIQTPVIVCSLSVAAHIAELPGFKGRIDKELSSTEPTPYFFGTYKTTIIQVDPFLPWGDMRLFDSLSNPIKDLSSVGLLFDVSNVKKVKNIKKINHKK